MTDQPPGYTPPKANAWKDAVHPLEKLFWSGWTWVAALVLALSLGGALFCAIRQHTGAAAPVGDKSTPTQPAPPHFHMEVEESQGGITTTKGTTDGPSMHGDNINVKDLVCPIMSFDFGSIGGASFKGSLSVTQDTANILRWVCLIFAIPCIVVGTVKWVAKDYAHAIGEYGCALFLIAAFAWTPLLGWFFLGAFAWHKFAAWFPSAANAVRAKLAEAEAKAQDTAEVLAQRERAIDMLPPDTQKQIRASTSEVQDAIATAAKAGA